MKKPIVAIDGPAGAGKSTIARKVAKSLGYLYIDTGAMYRAVAWQAIKNGVGSNDKKSLIETARKIKIQFQTAKKDGPQKVLVNGEEVSQNIRTEEVSRGSNMVAGIEEIRKILVNQQRKMGKKGGIVMEGRDVGTVVFPDAEFKFYLDASERARAKRRYLELKGKGKKVRLKNVADSLKNRDKSDQTREISPLKKALDAIVIDSTRLRIPQVVKKILNGVQTAGFK